ncbi:MAG: type II toxin-antitoxin system VapC family toxin [Mesorhizobium sp.]|nr:type II toxin-antitoxin system VapC family toxin [Mesorhizobium sp.]
MLVVDASVLAKIYVEEPGSAKAELVLSEIDLLVPGHAFGEAGEVLARKIRSGLAEPAMIERMIAAMTANFRQIPLEGLLGPAVELSIASGASVYDCLYVVAAMQNSCRLVTADGRLIDKMASGPHHQLLIPLDSYTGPG